MYSIEFSDTAEKQFLKLPKTIQKRVKSTLLRIRTRPFSYIKKLVGIPRYSLRVGDYRIILNIEKGKLVILVLELGHRKNIYKR